MGKLNECPVERACQPDTRELTSGPCKCSPERLGCKALQQGSDGWFTESFGCVVAGLYAKYFCLKSDVGKGGGPFFAAQ